MLKRRIYVSIMLFEGWGLRFVPDGRQQSKSPFEADAVLHLEAQ